jgi:hypothetical protein
MAQKKRVVRRIDERNDNLRTGGGQLIIGAVPTLAAVGAPDIPPPEDVTIGTQTLMRTTLVPKVLVNVTWNTPGNLLPELYVVQFAEDSAFTTNVQQQTTTLDRIALEMKPDTDYWVRVEAKIRGAFSEWGYPSNYPTASVHTIGDTTPPGPVVLNTISWVTGDLEFVWTNPTDTNFFETRVRIYDSFGGTLYKEVFVVGNRGGKSRYTFTVADNEDVSAGAYLKTVYYELLAYSIAGVPSATAVTGTITKAPPAKPTGYSSSWDGDDGTYDEGVTIAFNNQNFIKDYIVIIDGITKRTTSAQYVYQYTENVANHRPTLKSGDPNLSYTVQARDHLNQVSPGASGTATNIAPQSSNLTLTTAPGFSQLYAYVNATDEIKDINHYRWVLASGGGPVIRTVLTSAPEITFTTLKGIYDLQVYAVDHFGQASNPLTVSGLTLDGLTIQELRSETIYTSDDVQTEAAYRALNDGILNVAATSHALSASAWRWIQAERPLLDRYRTITFSMGGIAAGTVNIYFSISNDGTNWTYYSGPLVSTGAIAGNTTLTLRASEALAQSNPLAMVAGTVYRFDFPSIVEARYIRLHHRNTTSNYNFREFYPRRLLQSDDIEAESLKSINIAANAILADHISVTTLSAITANIGQLVIDTTGYIFQGTGTAATPTTGLKIDNSGGIGRLRTFNSGVVQISLDTDGKLKAGAGDVVLDATGINISAISGTSNGLKWNNSADAGNIGQIWALRSSSGASFDDFRIERRRRAGSNLTSITLAETLVAIAINTSAAFYDFTSTDATFDKPLIISSGPISSRIDIVNTISTYQLSLWSYEPGVSANFGGIGFNFAPLTGATTDRVDTSQGAAFVRFRLGRIDVINYDSAGNAVVNLTMDISGAAPRVSTHGVAAVGRQAITALTAASGTADNTVADVGAAFNQTTLNNNFKDLASKVNEIITILKAFGPAV